MMGWLVGLLTAIPIVVGAALGYRWLNGRVLVWLGTTAVAMLVGVCIVAYGLHAGWHWPFGLMTPLVAGLLAAYAVRQIIDRLDATRTLAAIERDGSMRLIGCGVGLLVGFALAVGGWQIIVIQDELADDAKSIALMDRVPGVQEAELRPAWSGLAEVAHEGFLKHVPLAGPLTDEMLAVATILDSPLELRKEFAVHKRWDALADLPSFQAIAEDEQLFAEIDAAASGNLVALYRLQKHPLILDFYREESLQAVISNLQATQVAEELVEFRNEVAISSHP